MNSDSIRPPFELTAAQQAIVELDWSARALVTAGAGAGKTTMLTYRLERLTSAKSANGDEPLEAAEILALSFSRAAVRALRDRIDRVAESARRVRAYTFDGWARSVLHEYEPDRDLTGLSFDDIIVAATESIRAGIFDDGPDGPVIEPPSHLVIDEVQDLVGVRRSMVEALLAATRDCAGFTVVGDAAQSIYGFQIEDLDERAAEANRFFGWLRAEFVDDLVERRLDENFRARSDEAKIALGYGPRLQSIPADRAEADLAASAIQRELCAALSNLPSFGALVGKGRDEFALASLRDAEGSTAVLCTTNGQVLQLSASFCREGIAHTIQRSPKSRPAPSWMVRLFQAVDGGPTISEHRFHRAVEGLVDEPCKVWRSLRMVASGRAPSVVDLERLHRVIAEQRVPDDLVDSQARGVLLSTVHRAKGLEFDRVLVLDEDEDDRRDADVPGQARRLYVALTRAREDNYRLEPFRSWVFSGNRRNPRFNRWHTFDRYNKSAGLEFGDVDVARERPAQMSDTSAVSIQEYLAVTVQPGDLVRLVSEPPIFPEDDVPPSYGIWHGGIRIGEASEQFLEDLARSRRKYPKQQVRRWPDAIEWVHIDCVETVGGSTAETARAGLGSYGVWLAPRLCGLGTYVWAKADQESRDPGKE
ncbi:UvrD-helicase domain-containing protein [Nocardia sp. NPDC058176]|uniref:UvrD-helicase domain-containing protein n=1 Tax=Nocardia sp. NPDC058176 TaxID=3346368 RepID=UPI0036DD6863